MNYGPFPRFTGRRLEIEQALATPEICWVEGTGSTTLTLIYESGAELVGKFVRISPNLVWWLPASCGERTLIQADEHTERREVWGWLRFCGLEGRLHWRECNDHFWEWELADIMAEQERRILDMFVAKKPPCRQCQTDPNDCGLGGCGRR